MREGWKEVRLGDLITTKKGFAFKSGWYVKFGIPVVRVSDFTENSISQDSIFYVAESIASEYSTVKLDHKDIIIQTVGSWQHNPASIVGKVVRVPSNLTSSLLNQNAVKLIPNQRIFKDFLYYRLKEDSFKYHNLNFAQGAANQASVTLETIKCFKFSLPPLETQRKISSILSGYDDLIENNLKRIKILEEMVQQTYEEWFVRMRFPGYDTSTGSAAVIGEDGLPEGWEKVKLREMLALNYGKALKQDVRVEGNYNVYGSSGVVGTHNEYLVNGPSLIIGRKGNVGSVYYEPNSFYPIDTVYYVTTRYSLYFLYYSIRNLKFINNDAAVPGLNRDAAYFKEVLKPSVTVMNYFQNYCESRYELIHNLQSQNQRLREVRDILLPRLMMGIIDVEKMEVKNVGKVEVKPTDATIIPLKQSKKEASKEFKEAVLIACLTDKFGSEKYPLGRKRYTKLSYLFHRYADNKIQDYLRKAAGPYNPKTKYAGPEKIALNSKYIQNWKGEKGTTGFVTSEKIEDAKKYFSNYWQAADLDWLVTEFKFKSNDELELLATVDNSLVELYKKNLEFTTSNVLGIIKSEKEWEAKLERMIFSYENVERAIGYLKGVLEYGNN
ncbi:restriction endonuclease subunit S [Pedobacter frigoris]|uniref:restriction endonuclease subunit S n=1 Tax=Pedobacter frigoris TaxID=2571272 RepID=UPI00292D3EE4|nr:restriction endonuclease subunit S [Pedobacter frigoris]